MRCSADHKPTLALVQGIFQAQGRGEAGRRQWQALVLRTFLHPFLHRKGRFGPRSSRDLVSGMSTVHLTSGRRQIERVGRQCPQPTSSSYLLRLPPLSKITSSSHSWLCISPTLHFPNGPGAQMGLRGWWKRSRGRRQRLLAATPSHRSALSWPISAPPPHGSPPPSQAQGGAGEAA